MEILRWIGKIAAVLSALILGIAYVASRTSPGLLENLQVFGGEGGGQSVSGDPAGTGGPQSDNGAGGFVLAFSSKSDGGVVTVQDVDAYRAADGGSLSTSASLPSGVDLPPQTLMGSSKSGTIFAPASPPPFPTQTILSNGTVIRSPNGAYQTPSALSGASPMMPRPTIIDGNSGETRLLGDPPAIDFRQLGLSQHSDAGVAPRNVPPPPNPPQFQQVPQRLENQAPAEQKAAQPPRGPQVMSGSKSAPVFLYNGNDNR